MIFRIARRSGRELRVRSVEQIGDQIVQPGNAPLERRYRSVFSSPALAETGSSGVVKMCRK